MENHENVVRKSALAMTAGSLPRGLNFAEDVDGEGDADPSQNGAHDATLQQNRALMQLISDPDVAAVVALKRQGKVVQVGEKQVEEEKDDPADDPDPLASLAEDDPHKELLTKLGAFIDAKLAPVSRRVEKQLGELSQKSDRFESVANDITRKEVDSQIASVKAKFPDLDKVKPKMLELSKAHPSLNVEQLALLAMNEAGTLKLQKSSLASEKPTNIPRRPTAGTKEPQTRMGRKGFNEILAEKLAGLDLELKE
jgi:hypothetical protein